MGFSETLGRWIRRDGAEAKHLLSLGFPVFLALVSNRVLSTVSLGLVGRIGSTELAAAGLATSLANVSGESVLIGLSGALQTLCGQAFGAKAYGEVGNLWQRSAVILWVACLPISVLWWFSDKLLLATGQQQDVAALGALFLRWRIPGIWAYAGFQATQGYLQSQGTVLPPMLTNFATALLHPFWSWLLIKPARLGYSGAAIAYSIANVTQFVLLVAVVFIFGLQRNTFHGLSWAAFKGWWAYVKLALPSLVMLGEWWSTEIVTVAAGRLDNATEALSAMSVFQQTNSLAFMVPLGLSIGVGIRTSNELGAAQPSKAKHAALVAMRMSLVVAALLGLTIELSRHKIGKVFTGDPQVLDVTSNVMIVMGGYIALDGLQSVLSGIIRGTGRQAVAAPVIFVSYYVIGLPTSFFLAFKLGWGVVGLCTGQFLGTICNSLTYAVVCLRTDWRRAAYEASLRTGNSKEESEALLHELSGEEEL